MKGTGAAYGCDWCVQKAYFAANRQVYKINKNAPYRNVDDIKMVLNNQALLLVDSAAEGIVRNTPVLRLYDEVPGFDFIWSIPLDSMHCIHMGITKRFYKMLFENLGNKNVYQTVAAREMERNRVDKLLDKTKVPSFFARRTRTMVDSAFYKSSEWQCMDMMFMPAMALQLSEDGPGRTLAHMLASWSFFVRALYYDKPTRDMIEEQVKLDDILHEFLRNYQDKFGKEQITYNLHIIEHAQESVNRTGPLWKTSASRFEASYQKVTSNYRAGTYNVGKQALINFYLCEGANHFCYDRGNTKITTAPTDKTDDSIIKARGQCYKVEEVDGDRMMCREIFTEGLNTENLGLDVPWKLVGVTKITGHSLHLQRIRKSEVQSHLVSIAGTLVEAKKEWMIK